MAIDKIVLVHCHQANLDIASFGVINVDARDGHPPTVQLMVATGEEHCYDPRPGDTFPAGDQTWRLERVGDAESHDWAVVLVRVG